MRLVGVCAALVLIGSSCSDSRPRSPLPPGALVVNASEPSARRYQFTGIDSSVPAGLVQLTLVNGGREPHDLQVLRLDDAHTLGDVVKVVTAPSGSPIPDWLHYSGGVGTILPRQSKTAYMALKEGRYAFVCTLQNDATVVPHSANGMSALVQVVGGGTATVPPSPATVTAKDYSFDLPVLRTGVNTIEFHNAGAQPHQVQAFPILPGRTFDEVRKNLVLPYSAEQGPPPIDIQGLVTTAALDPGGRLVTWLDLKPGRYVFACFVTDRAGGEPHANKGMVQEAEVGP